MGKRSFCISSNEVAGSHFLLLLVAGTGALVMALRGVELISNGKADVARVVVAVLGALYAVAVHRPALRTALEDVVGKGVEAERIVLETVAEEQVDRR